MVSTMISTVISTVFVAVVCGLILGVIGGGITVQTATADAGANTDTAAIDPDRTLSEVLENLPGQPLTLETAIDWALRNAIAMREAQAAVEAAEGVWMREKGAFDPQLFAQWSRSSSETPSSSPFARPDVVEDEVTTASAGARWLLPLGTEIEIALDARELDTNSEFTVIDPEYRADGRLSIRQPLLRGLGAGTSSERAATQRLTRRARELEQEARLLTQANVEIAFWQLYAAERDYAVGQLIVEQAEALLQQSRYRAEAGLAGPNETANARVFLAQRSLAVLDQEERLGQLSDQLTTLLGRRPEPGRQRYRTMSDPAERFGVRDVETLIRQAYAANPTLQAAQSALAAAEVLAQGAKWQRLPRLDLFGELGGTGLAGDSREVIFGGDTLTVAVDGGYQSAIDDVLAGEFPAWTVGLELSVPIGLREGRGTYRRARADVDAARARVEAFERLLEEDVRSAHRELENGSRRLDLAREGVDASYEQVRVGLIEYENGRTTAFELVRLAADLAEAQTRLSEALVRTARAAAQLRYLTAEQNERDASRHVETQIESRVR